MSWHFRNRYGDKAVVGAVAPFDPSEHNVADVLEHVEANPDQAADVLAAEQAGKARSTIIDALSD